MGSLREARYGLAVMGDQVYVSNYVSQSVSVVIEHSFPRSYHWAFQERVSPAGNGTGIVFDEYCFLPLVMHAWEPPAIRRITRIPAKALTILML